MVVLVWLTPLHDFIMLCLSKISITKIVKITKLVIEHLVY
jgi:hypothetical protein